MEHNARINGGRTFRWVTPIPVFTISGQPAFDQFLLNQFTAWEATLGGAGGRPFFSPQAPTGQLPDRGIFFLITDLPGRVIGRGDPTMPFAQVPQGAFTAAQVRRAIPELTAGGEIRRCAVELDPALLTFGSDRGFTAAIRHEIGHCLGFAGHVPSGLMQTGCNVFGNSCSLTITEDVGSMMRTLYTVPVGTPVIP